MYWIGQSPLPVAFCLFLLLVLCLFACRTSVGTPSGSTATKKLKPLLKVGALCVARVDSFDMLMTHMCVCFCRYRGAACFQAEVSSQPACIDGIDGTSRLQNKTKPTLPAAASRNAPEVFGLNGGT